VQFDYDAKEALAVEIRLGIDKGETLAERIAWGPNVTLIRTILRPPRIQ